MNEQVLSHQIELLLGVELNQIEQITIGCSQQVYRITTASGVYVVKRFGHRAAFDTELTILAANKAYAPRLIASQPQLIISEYINAPLLGDCQLSKQALLEHLVNALVLFHNNPPVELNNSVIKPLNFYQVLTELASSCQLSPHQTANIDTLLNKVKRQEQGSESLVICHGDLNMNNLFVEPKGYKLIDFEAVSIAPNSYDLMMALSINGLSATDIDAAVKRYNSSSPNHPINHTTTKCYFYFELACAINALWFQARGQQQNIKSFRCQADKYFAQLSQ
ncbi:aminoglycoside phosphotransferase family protein [Thalassotalea sp. LPB0316]|uniref:aminoglycoside phosphotransferase family protein n=1 Tax=Thalassotalea sp. LPB0316 TaxID=2769490 RepID=UPI001865A5AB|nr:aminoglycoside phosphotransferase family protein [Thalassotalea sp. LPB0316]QOL24882.1 aminoglycoside phosphotransferase family protein [Thalassotalea sp. LPB0316]